MADVVTIHFSQDPEDIVREDAREIRAAITRTGRELEKMLPTIYRRYVPRDTGDLERSLEARVAFRREGVRVRVLGGAVRDGFDYLDVTRFGHRQRVIAAKKGRRLAVHWAGRASSETVIFAGSVKGYRPRRDWVEAAGDQADRFIDTVTSSLDSRVTTILER